MKSTVTPIIRLYAYIYILSLYYAKVKCFLKILRFYLKILKLIS